ncbi:MAG TPA: DUF488 domain-containing protein [Actinomycetales bacterium]|nr:DUF488 domain-containing protein [Actinomycetales bacterium]
MTELLTVGHGTLTAEAFGSLLRDADVALLVDVRSFPGSRAHPQFKREAMEQWLPDAGTAYRWEPRLGGRRRLPKNQPVVDTWWRVEAFRAYAAYTRTPEWADGFASLLADLGEQRVAVCCSEAVWWRCHRRLIADVVSLTQPVDVLDLAHDGRLTPHPVAEGARVVDGVVRWDVPDLHEIATHQ